MHKNTKLTPVMRQEVYKKWRTGKHSQRELATLYHVDKKVVARIVERGKKGDFSVHSSVNKRYVKKKPARKRVKSSKKTATTSKKKS